MTAKPVAIVDWRETGPHKWWAHMPGTGVSTPAAIDAMVWCDNHHGAPLRWEPAAPHTFHGYPIEPEETE